MNRHRSTTAHFHEDAHLRDQPIIRARDVDEQAALYVCSQATDADDARRLLCALGLLDYDRLGDL